MCTCVLMGREGRNIRNIRNIQSLAIEIHKFLHGLSSAIMGDIIKLNRPPRLYPKNSPGII